MSKSRAKGTFWESAIVNYLRANGAPYAERRALGGAQDKGDIAGLPGVVCEAKSAATVTLAAWLDEATTERDNAGAAIGFVWFKRRGKTSPGQGYVLMDGETLVRLLTEAGYIASSPPFSGEVGLVASGTANPTPRPSEAAA
jgi:hypothetical protein